MTVTVRKLDVFRVCGICQRTLLMGERAVRYSADGSTWFDVCALCTETALEHGWIKEGTPLPPRIDEHGPRRRRLPRLAELRRRRPYDTTATAPVLRRLSREERAIIEAVDRFNRSAARRTVTGIAKSLGQGRVSLVPLSGVNSEIVLTVAWEISWYQYRIVLESDQPVRLAERGYELDELDERFQHWNGVLEPGGVVSADIPRL